MALTFPVDPVVGQTHYFNGMSWVWNGTGWALIQPTKIFGGSLKEVLAALGVPTGAREVGEIIDFAGTVVPPLWLECYGQNVSRSIYSNLFSVIGTTFGAGDGSTTFGIPDLRGRVVAGEDDMGGSSANRLTSPLNGNTFGAAGGAETVTLTEAQIPAHVHRSVDSNGEMARGATTGTDTTNRTLTSVTSDTSSTSLLTGSTGGGDSHSNVQPTMILKKLIYAGA
jgi:microcystin-dependent protein